MLDWCEFLFLRQLDVAVTVGTKFRIFFQHLEAAPVKHKPSVGSIPFVKGWA